MVSILEVNAGHHVNFCLSKLEQYVWVKWCEHIFGNDPGIEVT